MEPLATLLIAALLNSLWQAVVLFLILYFLFRVMRVGNAATRYTVWSLALTFVLALPLVNLLRPVTEPHSPTFETPATLTPADSGSIVVAHPRSQIAETGTPPFRPLVEGWVPTVIEEFQIVTTHSVNESAWSFPIRLSPSRWPAFLLALWCGMTSALLFRVFWSFRHLSFLKQTSRPVNEKYDERLIHWQELSGSHRAVALRCSHGVTGPMAAGLMRPVILLPCSLLNKLSDDELDQVGLHEMAHLSRWDDWTRLGQKVVEALYFFNPAVYWMGRQLDSEREMACDDWVIFRTGKPKTYAACLTRLIEITGRLNAPVLAPGGWTTRKQIARRIEMSLKRTHPATPKVSLFGLLAGLFVLLFVGIQFARTSPLVVPPQQEEATTQERRPEEARNPERSLEEEPVVRRQMEAERKRELEELREREFRALQLREEQEGREQMMRSRLEAMEEGLVRAEERERELLASEPYLAFAHEEAMLGLPVLGFPHTLLGERSAISEGELIELMEEIAENDSDLKVQTAAIKTLGSLQSEEAAEVLIRLYDSLSSVELKKAVLSSLGYSRKLMPNVTIKLKEIVRSTTDIELRKTAVMALARLPGDEGAEALASIYDSNSEADLRKSIIRFLSASRSEKAVEKLKDIARSDSDADLRLMAVLSLGHHHRVFVVSSLDEEPRIFAGPGAIELAPAPPVNPYPAPEPPKPPKPPEPKR